MSRISEWTAIVAAGLERGRWRLTVVIAGLGIAAAPMAAAGVPPAPAMFRGNPQLTGVYDAPAPRALAGVRFTFRTGGAIRSTPAVVGSTVYVGSSDGNLYAIDTRSGNERWRVRTTGAVTSSPAVFAGLVYFTSRDARLYAVDARTGDVRWTRDLGHEPRNGNYWDYFLSSPTIASGRVYVGSGSGAMYAFDARTGRPSWRFDVGARIRTTPAVQDGLVVFGAGDGRLYALAADTGAARWRFDTKGAAHVFADAGNDSTSIVASPSIADGVVTVGGRDGMLYAVDLRTGAPLWQADHDGSSWVLSTAIRDGVVYAGSGSALFVQAADLRTGAERWRVRTRGAVFSSLTLAGDVLVFGDFAGDVRAIDTRDGATLWTFPLGHRIFSTPVVAGDTVYCASDDGTLVALDVAAAPATPPPSVDKVVYWEGRRTPEAFSWFQNDVDRAILAYFKSAGYRQVDAGGLAALMEHQVAPSRSVVVLADNRIPASIADESMGTPLIRRYLDGGGKLALLGANPLAYKGDPATGVVESIDFSVPARVFGVRFPEPEEVNGYYDSRPTAEGARWGLREAAITYAGVDPHQDMVVLARDEFGLASMWSKRYSGPPGTGLLQLSVPRQSVIDLAELQRAIEFGVGW